MTLKSIVLALFLFFLSSFLPEKSFLAEQKKFERVKKAISEKEIIIKERLDELKIKETELHLLIVAFKAEQKLELYAKKKTDDSYSLLQTYNICASSGELGPKRKQGDDQVPEGFYHIDRFNPASSYYLSLGINYPNSSDKKKSTAKNLGGDIFIHGECVTIGCMPMTNDKIKEIYLYAIHARNNGQSKIPVYIFPFKMSDDNFTTYSKTYKNNTALIAFWSNLKLGYAYFNKKKKELKCAVDTNGNYTFVSE